jgi:UDP-N-acetylmuramyl pentapeptide synthase
LSDWLIQTFKSEDTHISINLLWEENIEYTILALKIAKDIWMIVTQGSYNFNYTLQPWRFNIFERNKNIFIDSSYNAGPESMKKIIENTQLVQRELYDDYKIIYVLGDMREIWEARESAHIGLAKLVENAAAVMLIWPDTYSYTLPELKKSKFSGDIHSSLSSREVWKYLKKYLKDNNDNNYVILFKGSQNTIFTEEALFPQLLSSQQKNLPRQSGDWQKKKDEFFKSL